jgi:hypothetical protein
VASGWAGVRVVLLWPEGATLPQAIEAAFPLAAANAAAAPVVRIAPPRARTRNMVNPALPPPSAAAVRRGEEAVVSLAALGMVYFASEQVIGAPPGTFARTASVTQPLQRPYSLPMPTPSHWSASAWFVTRRGAPASGPMLGGDQAGVRIAYALDPARGLGLYARASAPLGQPGRELAIGVEWQPGQLPLRVVAEQRFGLDGNAGGTGLGVVGGVSDVALGGGFDLEAYGQAGAVIRQRTYPFADGALRVTRTVARRELGRIEIGGGAWGAAQREAARLDIGPSAVATLPVAGRAVRVALDWRERIAGDARPGSGPALTVGADF